MNLKNFVRRSLIVKAAALSLLAAIAVASLLAGRYTPGSQAAVSVPAAGGVDSIIPVSYPFPGRAENLDPGEYWWLGGRNHGGVQQSAYDLGTIRFDWGYNAWSEKRPGIAPWTVEKDTDNDDWLPYGQPTYAIADGEVVRCWRNAPENNPGSVLPEVDDKDPNTPPQIAGGGNHLWVRHDNGQYALYAHFQPGTIPANVCPIPNQYITNFPSQMDLPAGNRPRITKGQKIGLIGNSGSSSHPHLHIHLQTSSPDSGNSSNAVPLRFNRAWVKSTTTTPDLSSEWERLMGEELTSPPTAIMPDYSEGFAEIARHGVRAADFQFVFDHTTKSGYRMVWVDGYEVNGANYFNLIFRPADGTPWVARVGMNNQEYADEFDLRVGQGFRPLQVESYMDGFTIRYAVIFVKQAGPGWVTYHGKTEAEQNQLFSSLLAQGFIPRNISVVAPSPITPQRFYTAFYEKVPVTGLVTLWAMTPGEYQTHYNLNAAAGRKLVYLNAYQQLGDPRFTAIWVSPVAGVSGANHGLSGAQYQSEWEHWTGLGYLTRLVTGYEQDNHARFAGLWRRQIIMP